MRSDLGFYLIDHRLIALAMLMVLAVACEIGYRAVPASRPHPIHSARS